MKQGTFGCRDSHDRIGILIAQLGTPEEPTGPALRSYLKEFLWDPRVIEVNRVLWWFLLNGVILNTRPKKSAALYRRIWTDEGSPLLLITKELTSLVEGKLKQIEPSVEVAFGMRYGSPSLEAAIDQLCDSGCTKILLVPMYPQYSGPTTASVYDAVFPHLRKRRSVPTLRVVEPYYAHPGYIEAQASVIQKAYEGFEQRPEKLLLSYHGVPEAYVEKGDPYCCQCAETTLALKSQLKGFKEDEILHTFQSRFGRDPWLTPYTDETVKELAEQGKKHIAIACPGFLADCLETIDEIGYEAQVEFEAHGGEKIHLIPCLNTDALWVENLTHILVEELGSWLETAKRSQQGSCLVRCPVAQAKTKLASS